MSFLTKVLDPLEITMEDIRNIEKYRDRKIMILSFPQTMRKDEIIEELKRVNDWLRIQYLNITI